MAEQYIKNTYIKYKNRRSSNIEINTWKYDEEKMAADKTCKTDNREYIKAQKKSNTSVRLESIEKSGL